MADTLGDNGLSSQEGPNAPPTMYADFQNADPFGRVRLNTDASLGDLNGLVGVPLEGLPVVLSDGELAAEGVLTFSEDESIWVAAIDWAGVRDA